MSTTTTVILTFHWISGLYKVCITLFTFRETEKVSQGLFTLTRIQSDYHMWFVCSDWCVKKKKTSDGLNENTNLDQCVKMAEGWKKMHSVSDSRWCLQKSRNTLVTPGTQKKMQIPVACNGEEKFSSSHSDFRAMIFIKYKRSETKEDLDSSSVINYH